MSIRSEIVTLDTLDDASDRPIQHEILVDELGK
jgi:hypothetical protein